jgi:hypothetical protein
VASAFIVDSVYYFVDIVYGVALGVDPGRAARSESREPDASLPERRLYYHPVAPNRARVLYSTTEKGLQQQGLLLEFVDLIENAQNSPAFLRKNPHGALLLLELPDGTCLIWEKRCSMPMEPR